MTCEEAGIKREGEGSSGVTVAYEARRNRGYPEETAMWPTWGTLPPWWHHLMRVVLVAVVLCLSASACTTSGRSGSTPTALPHEGGYAGPRDSGKSGDGY